MLVVVAVAFPECWRPPATHDRTPVKRKHNFYTFLPFLGSRKSISMCASGRHLRRRRRRRRIPEQQQPRRTINSGRTRHQPHSAHKQHACLAMFWCGFTFVGGFASSRTKLTHSRQQAREHDEGGTATDFVAVVISFMLNLRPYN